MDDHRTRVNNLTKEFNCEFGQTILARMKCILILLISITAFQTSCYSQPYIDLVNTRLVNSPDYRLFGGDDGFDIQYFNISTTLPIQFQNKDALIFSPYFENWTIQNSSMDSRFRRHQGFGLPVSFLKNINSQWTLLTTVIGRMNGGFGKNEFQLGGAVLAGYKTSDKLTLKGGLYVNDEFFGLFVIPLLGLDWKIGPTSNLFGVLPGNLIFEQKIADIFYAGIQFRAQTNSYRIDPEYVRINENQLGVFLDFYLLKNLVFNIEGGHAFVRKITSGIKDQYKFDWNARDNFYGKVGLAYRIRSR